MLRYIYLSLAALLIFLAGCEDEKYSIEMRPCEEGIERTLVVSGFLSLQVPSAGCLKRHQGM